MIFVMRTIKAFTWTFLFSSPFAQSLTLDGYIKKVLVADISLKEARLQENEIAAKKKQLAAERLPSFSYSITGSQSQQGPRDVFVGSVPVAQPATSYEYYSTGLSLTHQLFDYGNSFRRIKSLNYNRDVLKSDYRVKARVLINNAASVFLDLMAAEEILRLYKEEIIDMRRLKVRLDDLIQKGVKPPVDKIRMEITLNEIDSKIRSQNNKINRLRSELSYFMHSEVNQELALVIDKNPTVEKLPKFSQMVPALSFLTDQIRVNETDLDILKWDRFPDIYINSGYTRGNTFPGALYRDFDKDWNMYVSLSVSLPIFQNRKHALKETQKQIQINRLKEELVEKRRKVNKEVGLLTAEIQLNGEQIILQKKNVDNLRLIYDHELERYNTGLIEYHTINEARNAWLQSRQKLVSQKYIYLKNREKLNIFIGGWDNAIASTYVDFGPNTH